MERAGIAEGSPAGETSGRGAVPGPAQDDETSTVDQSREWPYRDTAPRQDPTESRRDPIWGADPPDAVQWHMDMATNEETAAADTQDPQPQAHRNGTTTPAGSPSSASAGATGQAPPPAEAGTAYREPDEPDAATSRDARSEAGWFSTESEAEGSGAARYEGMLPGQLSSERPGSERQGDEPSKGLGADGQASARAPGDLDMDAPDRAGSVGAEDSTLPDSRSGIDESSGAGGPRVPEEPSGIDRSVGSGTPMDAGGPSSVPSGHGPAGESGSEGPATAEVGTDSVGPQASSGGDTETGGGPDNASFGTGSAPDRHGLHGPELIQAGMVSVDPEPEIGSPPSAADWSERSDASSGSKEGPSGRTSASPPQEQREGHARARDIVESPEAHPSGKSDDDGTSTAEPAPTDHGKAERAADESPTATATEMATSAVPRDVARSTQAGPAASTEASGSFPPSHAGDPSIGEGTAGPAAAADDSQAGAEAAAAAGAATETGIAGAEGEAARGGVSEAGDGAEVEAAPRGSEGTGDRIEREAETRAVSKARDRAEAAEATGPADAAGGSSDSTDDTPWDEPALPMGWPPGVGPSARGGVNASSAEEEPDSELGPEPDPTWPRLFGHGLEGEDDGGPGDLSNGGQATTGLPHAISQKQSGEGAAESSYSQPGEIDHASDGGSDPPSTGEPGGVTRISGGRGASMAAPVSAAHHGGQSADQGMTPPKGAGAPEPPGAVPAGVAGGAGSSMAPGHADTPPDSHGSVVDNTTRGAESEGAPGAHPGLHGPTPETGRLDAAASPAEGGVGPAGHANMSTALRSAGAAAVDLREASPGSVDVSRETSADGGEAMESGREDEALEDEAAIAVRDAVSRAAAEAGVDVSRETDPMAADLMVDEPIGEAVIDSESAARNARVTFRIHHDTQNGTRRVLAVANQKGGVGKSTTAVNIGAYLALAGARVLVIDLDPQGNASTGLGLDHREIEPSIYDVLTGEAAPSAAVRATGVPGLHVLPSTIDLAGAEVELVSAMSRETRLRRALQSIDHQYDTILIDCPPSLGLLTVNALAAADELLIPIQCEYYALEGLGQLLRNVELVRANLNPELRIGGIVLTMYDGRTRLALQVVEEVRKHFTDIVYQTVVPRSVRLSEAPGYGLPIALYDPLSRGGIAYRDLTFELAERSGLLAPTGEGAS
jgi:chromosome partitioning protein